MMRPLLVLLLAGGLLASTHGVATAEGKAQRRPAVATTGPAADALLSRWTQFSDRASTDLWRRRAYAILQEEGWWWARVRLHDGRLELRPGPRARLRELEIRGANERDAQLFRNASGLEAGRPLSAVDWVARLRAGLEAIGNLGYPFAAMSLVSIEENAATGEVDVVLSLFLERQRRIGEVEIHGATHTRPTVLARLSGLDRGELYRTEDLEQARRRLTDRQLVEEVESVSLRPAGAEQDEVDVRMDVRQPARFGRASAALGLVREEGGEQRLSGEVELALLDLFGTARQFQGRWSDDGVQRRRLDLEYLEPAAFGLPFDLRFELGQIHEDELYDLVRGGVGGRFLWGDGRELEISLSAERTTFSGERGRVRWRRRAGAVIALRRDRPPLQGFYGHLRSQVEAAQVSQTESGEEGIESVDLSTTQTIVDAGSGFGFAFTPAVAVAGRAHWQSVETDELPLPRGEQWYLGGARTVRGYREQQFHGERTAYGGLELVLGPDRRGQAYGFADYGWIQETVEGQEGLREVDHWLFGFGVGLRSPTRLGAIDLSVGFAEEVSLDVGKLHLSILRSF